MFFAAGVIEQVLLLLCSAQGSPASVQETPGRGRKRTGSKRTVQLPSSLLLPCPHHCCPHSQSALPVPVSFLTLLSPFTVTALSVPASFLSLLSPFTVTALSVPASFLSLLSPFTVSALSLSHSCHCCPCSQSALCLSLSHSCHCCPRSQSALPVPVSFLSLLSPFTVSAGCPLGTEICCFTDSLNLN